MERNQCILNPSTRIALSIASEEEAIACLLNAECTKLHKAICMARSIDDLLAINNSVIALLNSVANLENQLHQKLELVVE